MADSVPKFNVAPALTIPLAFAPPAFQFLAQLATHHGDKVTFIKTHPLVEQVRSKSELVLALLGLALIFHGAQFKNLLLCSQVVAAFLYDRVAGSVQAICSDIQTAREKLQADQPQDTSDEKTKKKAADNKAEKQREDAEVAKKALGALSSERLSAAAVEVLASGLACLVVLHGGLAQKFAIANALVGLTVDKVEAFVEFKGHDDIKAWTSLFVRVALYAVFLPLALAAAPVALALDAAACGARLATEHGVRFLASIGKVGDADAFLASQKGYVVFAGMAAAGALWQIWTLAAGGGMAWYFTVLYLPAVIAEGVIGLL